MLFPGRVLGPRRSTDEGDTRDVASQRLKRTMRGALTAGAVMAIVSLSPTPALADPPASGTNQPAPKTASEAMKQYQALSKQAETVNEDLLKAQDDLKHKNTDLKKANTDLGKAKGMVAEAGKREEQFRGQVDQLAGASFEGARFNQLSALFTGTNAQDFLDRASALNILASGNAKVLGQLQSAVNEAEQGRTLASSAQSRAATAKTTAQNLVNQINRKKTELAKQINKVRESYNKLSGAEVSSLNGNYDKSLFIAPPGTAGKAMQEALNQVGKQYVWGAAGPNTFDCSGLTMWAYGHAGISLPHSSRAQYQMGVPVSRDALQPGDLLFFGSSAGSIHHVAMYIGDGKVVHAATSGQPVKISPVEGAGSDYFGAKRIVSS
jgi:cell wall-associated NlpC family hydrolase